MSAKPPCSFCGANDTRVNLGFRVLMCDRCVALLRARLADIATAANEEPIHQFVAGEECVLCGKFLSTANFSVRRWIFGICDACACGVTGTTVDYHGTSAQSYEF